jgi:hypothetical protein
LPLFSFGCFILRGKGHASLVWLVPFSLCGFTFACLGVHWVLPPFKKRMILPDARPKVDGRRKASERRTSGRHMSVREKGGDLLCGPHPPSLVAANEVGPSHSGCYSLKALMSVAARIIGFYRSPQGINSLEFYLKFVL